MKRIKSLILIAAALSLGAPQAGAQTSFCNPLNLEYRFNLDEGTYREAADPVVIIFDDDYYIFASMSGGYWWSSDFANWTFVEPDGSLGDIELYAPSVWEYNGKLYYTTSTSGDIYCTSNPKKGHWVKYCDNPHEWNDPWIFVDDDERVYAYFGCAENGDISCCELDPSHYYSPLTDDIVCIETNTEENGYEVGGDNNEDGDPWTEGSAMFKYNGKYYLTYATPGTQLQTYCDGYYVSDSPTGPFTRGDNSPCTYKSLGFVTGVGHGGLFTDKAGRVWTIDCVCIANKAWFERRLAVFPVGIDDDGMLHSYTAMGDYPLLLPGTEDPERDDMQMGWNLISYGKSARGSTVYEGNSARNVTDESIKTYWSSRYGDAGQYLRVDLGEECTVNAVQINFYEVEATYTGGRADSMSTKYLLEYSLDASEWTTIIDKSDNTYDYTHDYIVLDEPVTARYVRVTNEGDIPGDGKFAVSEFRIFGTAPGDAPDAVTNVTVERSSDDGRQCVLTWDPSDDADGYIVRLGVDPEKLYNHYMVWEDTTVDMRSLIVDMPYYYRVDAINGAGVTIGAEVYDDSGIATGIDPATVSTCPKPAVASDAVYNLKGQKVDEASMKNGHGVVITNGKKVIY